MKNLSLLQKIARKTSYFSALLIVFACMMLGCKEERDGGWPPFEWKIVSVSNTDEIKVGIDKEKDINIALYSNTGGS